MAGQINYNDNPNNQPIPLQQGDPAQGFQHFNNAVPHPNIPNNIVTGTIHTTSDLTQHLYIEPGAQVQTVNNTFQQNTPTTHLNSSSSFTTLSFSPNAPVFNQPLAVATCSTFQHTEHSESVQFIMMDMNHDIGIPNGPQFAPYNPAQIQQGGFGLQPAGGLEIYQDYHPYYNQNPGQLLPDFGQVEEVPAQLMEFDYYNQDPGQLPGYEQVEEDPAQHEYMDIEFNDVEDFDPLNGFQPANPVFFQQQNGQQLGGFQFAQDQYQNEEFAQDRYQNEVPGGLIPDAPQQALDQQMNLDDGFDPLPNQEPDDFLSLQEEDVEMSGAVMIPEGPALGVTLPFLGFHQTNAFAAPQDVEVPGAVMIPERPTSSSTLPIVTFHQTNARAAPFNAALGIASSSRTIPTLGPEHLYINPLLLQIPPRQRFYNGVGEAGTYQTDAPQAPYDFPPENHVAKSHVGEAFGLGFDYVLEVEPIAPAGPEESQSRVEDLEDVELGEAPPQLIESGSDSSDESSSSDSGYGGSGPESEEGVDGSEDQNQVEDSSEDGSESADGNEEDEEEDEDELFEDETESEDEGEVDRDMDDTPPVYDGLMGPEVVDGLPLGIESKLGKHPFIIPKVASTSSEPVDCSNCQAKCTNFYKCDKRRLFSTLWEGKGEDEGHARGNELIGDAPNGYRSCGQKRCETCTELTRKGQPDVPLCCGDSKLGKRALLQLPAASHNAPDEERQ